VRPGGFLLLDEERISGFLPFGRGDNGGKIHLFLSIDWGLS
jgi:hypothetical protein